MGSNYKVNKYTHYLVPLRISEKFPEMIQFLLGFVYFNFREVVSLGTPSLSYACTT
jgi:hypothetical protein